MIEGITRTQVEDVLGDLAEFTDHPWGVRIRPEIGFYFPALVRLRCLYGTDNICIDVGDLGDENNLADAGSITIYRD